MNLAQRRLNLLINNNIQNEHELVYVACQLHVYIQFIVV